MSDPKDCKPPKGKISPSDNRPPEIKALDLYDKRGYRIRQWDIIRVDHFTTKRGRGRKMWYMWKIATFEDTKNPKFGYQWYFYHTPERKHLGGYYPSFNVGKTLEDCTIMDSSETLREYNNAMWKRLPKS